MKSVDGWVVFVTGVHEEAQEDDIMDAFSEHGTVNKVQINVDRQTGLVKGYALVEYATQSEAQDAINNLHGSEILGKKIGVNWAFVKPSGYHSGGG
jgi:RNA-binding protein 8A